jgi:probable phosphoglycerate mutase
LRLLLIRHAQTVWNAAGRVQGQADPPLSDLGRAQCHALRGRVTGLQLDSLVSSDLERARVTADAVSAATATPVRLEPGLREVGLGDWEGFDRDRMQREYPDLYRRWRAEPSWDIVPGGEGATPFRERVVGTVARAVAGAGDNDTVALVTHIGVIRLILSMVAGLESMGLRWPWAIDNTAITTLEGPAEVMAWTTPALRVLAVNDVEHLVTLGEAR